MIRVKPTVKKNFNRVGDQYQSDLIDEFTVYIIQARSYTKRGYVMVLAKSLVVHLKV